MKFSVAMATYNGEKFLQEQLDSLATQTYLPHELVITDDGSTDRTLRIAEAFAQSAPFPVYIHRNPEKLGYGDNFLKAASLCTGDWIAFCDQDDVWHPDKLAIVGKAAMQPQCMLVVHSGALTDKHLQPNGRRMPDIRRDHTVGRLQNRIWWTPSGFVSVFDASLIHDIPWHRRPRDYNCPEECMKHDTWIYLLANVSGSITYISRALVSYRRHEDAVTGRYDRQGWPHALEGARKADAEHYELLSRISEEYQDLFQHLARSNQAEAKSRFCAAAWYYSRVAQWLHERAALYASASFMESMRRVSCLHASQAYRGCDGRGLGYRAMAKDIVYGLARNVPGLMKAKTQGK